MTKFPQSKFLVERKTFKEAQDVIEGEQKVYKFPNGYGASVICHSGSYGGPKGFWELAVLGQDGDIDYDTPITNDVIGWLTIEEAVMKLNEIRGLQRPENVV